MRGYYWIRITLSIIIFSGNAQPIEWKEIMPGVWEATVGVPESYDLLKASAPVPNVDALKSMPSYATKADSLSLNNL